MWNHNLVRPRSLYGKTLMAISCEYISCKHPAQLHVNIELLSSKPALRRSHPAFLELSTQIVNIISQSSAIIRTASRPNSCFLFVARAARTCIMCIAHRCRCCAAIQQSLLILRFIKGNVRLGLYSAHTHTQPITQKRAERNESPHRSTNTTLSFPYIFNWNAN